MKFEQAAIEFCKSSDKELDEVIFKVFDLEKNGRISRQELNLILFNIPMIGFCEAQSLLRGDTNYFHVF